MPPNYIDRLPLEVIRTFIVPHLDYNSRVSLNHLLQANERFIYKLDKIKIKQIELKFSIKHIKKALLKTEDTKGKEKEHALIEFFGIFEKNLVVLQHCLNFRIVALEKVRNYMNPEHHEYDGRDETFIRTLSEICKHLYTKIMTTYTFLYDLGIPIDTWNIVYHSSVIIDNTQFAEELQKKKLEMEQNKRRQRYILAKEKKEAVKAKRRERYLRTKNQ